MFIKKYNSRAYFPCKPPVFLLFFDVHFFSQVNEKQRKITNNSTVLPAQTNEERELFFPLFVDFFFLYLFTLMIILWRGLFDGFILIHLLHSTNNSPTNVRRDSVTRILYLHIQSTTIILRAFPLLNEIKYAKCHTQSHMCTTRQ